MYLDVSSKSRSGLTPTKYPLGNLFLLSLGVHNVDAAAGTLQSKVLLLQFGLKVGHPPRALTRGTKSLTLKLLMAAASKILI